MGQCSQCGEWNSVDEEIIQSKKKNETNTEFASTNGRTSPPEPRKEKRVKTICRMPVMTESTSSSKDQTTEGFSFHTHSHTL